MALVLVVLFFAFTGSIKGQTTVSTTPTVVEDCPRFVYEYKLLERILKTESDIVSLQQAIADLEQNTTTPWVVAVYVGLPADQAVTIGVAIIYPRVLLNLGNGYDASDGVFTAPVSGVYIISPNVCLNDGFKMRAQLVHNGARIGFFIVGDEDWEHCNNIVVTHELAKDDRLWVEMFDGDATYLHQEWGWNSFTIILTVAT